MSSELGLKEIQKEWHGTLKSYAIGFLSSIILTASSFLLVIARPFSNQNIINTIIALAIVQGIFQLLFFLHVGQEAKPRWESVIFYFMILVMIIIVIGSLWIIFDLDYRVMGNMSKEMMHD